ncbi:transposase [Streptomyces spongiicola]
MYSTKEASWWKLHECREVRWSPSYFAASCGSAPLAAVKEYIANQKRPD